MAEFLGLAFVLVKNLARDAIVSGKFLLRLGLLSGAAVKLCQAIGRFPQLRVGVGGGLIRLHGTTKVAAILEDNA
jgi:hypothetical protein